MTLDYNALLHYTILHFVISHWFFMDWEISVDVCSEDREDKSVLGVSEFHLACTEQANN